MPTSRRRYQVTETEAVARAIDEAAKRWPGEPRSRLIVRAIVAGGTALEGDAASEDRLERLKRLKGAYRGAYGPGYLAELRGEWPA
ncbi:MAG: hypothetical protein KF742_04580 [Cryobacterium sp.]|nr:hypothetical protein [Cryobacterium sp.]